MRRRTAHLGIILLIITASTVQGMQLCMLYGEEFCYPTPPDKLAITYPLCCIGCNIQTMPVLDAAVSSDKFSKRHIHFTPLFFEPSLLHLQSQYHCLLSLRNIYSTGPPLFILHSTFRI